MKDQRQSGVSADLAAENGVLASSSARTPKLIRRGLQVASLSAMLGFAVVGAAATTRGCVATPVHGTSVPFPTNASTVAVRFTGQAASDATHVSIQHLSLAPATGPGIALTPQSKFLTPDPTITVQPDGKKTFDATYNVPKKQVIGSQSVTFWPEDDVTAFQVTERLSDNTTRKMSTISGTNTQNTHFLIGLADQPDTIGGDLTAQPPNQFEKKVNGQTNNTFLLLKRPNTDEAFDYYGSIQAPATFAAWKTNFGFPNTSDEFVTYYRNEQDLGFGREMHCRVSTSLGFATKAACYVSNYDNEDKALTHKSADLIATVAMDFDLERIKKNEDGVRFYVYGKTGDIDTSAVLDSAGNKAIPGLCLNCHGGNYDPAIKRVRGGHFLPFDTQFLPLPAGKPDQAAAFKSQNAIVRSVEVVNGSSPINPIRELTEGWYLKSDGTSGLFDTTTPYNGGFVPSGWSNDPGPYVAMVAPYCRSCHIAMDPSVAWNTKDQFVASKDEIRDRVCNKKGTVHGVPTTTGVVMPHSQRGYQKFWASGAQAVIAVDLGFGHCAFKQGTF